MEYRVDKSGGTLGIVTGGSADTVCIFGSSELLTVGERSYVMSVIRRTAEGTASCCKDTAAVGVVTLCNNAETVEYLGGDLIYLFDIATELVAGREVTVELIVTLEVVVKSLDKLSHGIFLFFKYHLLNCIEAVACICQTLGKYLTVVVEGTAVTVVTALFDTSLDKRAS